MNFPDHLTAVILAGGLGTRLREVVPDRPKVLADVAEKPFLSYLFDQLLAEGFRSAVLCTGYRAEMVSAQYGEAYGALRLRYSCETTPLGTGGAIRQALPLVETRYASILNGDSFFGAGFLPLWKAVGESGAGAGMLLAQVGDAARYGRVEISDTGWILGLHEKDGLSTPGLINAGKYIVQKEWIESIPAGRAVSLEREVFPDWVRRGFLGVESGAPFVDIGTPSSLVEGHQLFRDIESSSRAGDR